jgi:hypothetical protein
MRQRSEGVRGQVVPARKVGDDGGERVAGLDIQRTQERAVGDNT